MSETAKALFSTLQTGGWAAIKALVNERQQEGLHLEFTIREKANEPRLSKADKKKLSKTLSAFANAAGGVLVWGISAKQDDDGIDAADELVPIDSLEAFQLHLHHQTPNMVERFVPGVEHVAVPNPDRENEGVVLTLVPESDATPHMATAGGEHRYYRRNGDQSLVMEHYEVEDMFGQRAHPRVGCTVELNLTATHQAGDEISGDASFALSLQNRGRGLARFPCLSIGEPEGLKAAPLVLPRYVHAIKAPKGWWGRVQGGSDQVVYPDDELLLAIVRCLVPSSTAIKGELTIKYAAVADGCQPVVGGVWAHRADLWSTWNRATRTLGKPVPVPLKPIPPADLPPYSGESVAASAP